MSFIFGRIQPHQHPIQPDDPLPMVDRPSRRWQQGSAALGYYAAVAGDSTEFPLHDSASKLTITASLRLDNREELVRSLRISAECSDGQLILTAYQCWGTACVHHLLGSFAFAIWDQSEQQLFAARDYIGTRPLYYSYNHNRFLFASSSAALIQTPSVPDDLDFPYIAAHFRKGQNYPHATRTFYAAIRKLAPGHALLLKDGNLRSWRYWHADRLPDTRYKQETDYIERLRELLVDAVRLRLPKSGPVAAHVSGGLDCTSIAVLAKQQLATQNRSLFGYSWSLMPEGELATHDERRLVQQIEREYSIPIVYASAKTSDYIAHAFRNPITHHDAVESLLERSLRRHALANDVTTILSGWGGDELISFNGRGYFAELLQQKQWRKCWLELSKKATLDDGNRWKLLLTRCAVPHLPDRIVEQFAPHTLPKMWNPVPLPRVFSPAFNQQLMRTIPLPHPADRERPGVRDQQLRLLQRGHLTHRIEGWAAAGLRHGITYAYPLLDKRIAEFALGLPSELFFQHGWKRYLFRRVLDGTLPKSIVWCKSKSNPSVLANLQRGQDKSQQHLRVLEMLLENVKACEILDVPRLQRNVAARLQGKRGERGYFHAGMQLESLVNSEFAKSCASTIARFKNDNILSNQT